ncbi:hypothetical protein N0V83_007830 [Neocucurbitaria cava]|uniref:Rhodopsin domain-containing protein n=1 Tax=Neocucurbitaria cava TaxID=798079 RepID=A0A9W9CJS2_9PLEO|nr:hypothetical protein N0V83_007830 [Neocucurbitaria cava]
MVLLSACTVWSLHIEYRLKTTATVIFSLRLFLVAASIIRLLYLHQAYSDTTDPAFNFIPYAITTQCHSMLSVMLSCSLMLAPMKTLLQAPPSHTQKQKPRHSKHWSGTTIGGTPYETYDTFATTTTKPHIVKEPLTSIQASMSTPTSPATSRKSLLDNNNDILLPDILLPTTKYYAKAPPRPPPPPEEQRPDLTMFTKKTTIIREPPMVTRLGGSVRDKESARAWEKVGKDRSLRARGLA